VDFENRSSPRDNVRDGSRLGQFADIARDNKATISAAPSALPAFISHSLGLRAQAPAVREGPPYLLRLAPLFIAL